jgi:glucose-6-phosphate 1-dehydrogenase
VNDLRLQILDVCSQQKNLTVLSKILKRKENNRLFHIALPYDIMGKIIDKAKKEKIKK